MNTDTGEIRRYTEDQFQDEKARGARLVEINEALMTEKQRLKSAVSLRDNRSALGKLLVEARSKYVPHVGAKQLAKSALLSICFLLVATIPLTQSGCTQTPSSRVVAVQSLKAVGETAESAVALSAQLYRDRTITAVQARQVADLYDQKFQPAFRLAVASAKSDLSTIASPDLVSLASQLSALVASFK